MDPLLFFYLSSSDSENDERIIRKQLRDRSDPLALSSKAFIKRFGLNKEAFNFVLSKMNIYYSLDTKAVSPILKLAASLSLLASGCYQQDVGRDYLIGMSQSTVSKLTSNVFKEIENKLCPEFIKFEPKESVECKEWFLQQYKIPGVIGCGKGTHIRLQKPTKDDHLYLNTKGFHSINAMIICDHTCKILAINCQYGGAAGDSFVWKHSKQRMIMEEHFKQYEMKEKSWLLADSSYPLEPWFITPYRNPQDGSDEAVFNEIHSKALSIIDRTIGALKGRWQILANHGRGRYDPTKVARFANVCAALHNICIKFKINYNHTNYETESAPDVDVEEDPLTPIGQKIRDEIKSSILNSG